MIGAWNAIRTMLLGMDASSDAPAPEIHLHVDIGGATIPPGGEIDLGDVTVGQQTSANPYIHNHGDSGLVISSIDVDSPLVVGGGPGADSFTVGAGDIAQISLLLTPTATGAFSYSVTINSNDPTNPAFTFEIVGTAIAPELLDGLGLWLPLDEFSDGTSPVNRIDKTGQLVFVDVGNVPSTTGKIGRATQFTEGDSHYLHYTGTDLEIGTGSYTFACWFDAATKGYMFHKPGVFHVRHTDPLAIAFVHVSQPQIAQVNVWTPGTKQCVFAWYDADAGTINLQVDDGIVSSAATALVVTAEQDEAFIGTDGPDLTLDTMTCMVDEVAIWTRVLTADERAAYRNNGDGITYTSLITIPSTRLTIYGTDTRRKTVYGTDTRRKTVYGV